MPRSSARTPAARAWAKGAHPLPAETDPPLPPPPPRLLALHDACERDVLRLARRRPAQRRPVAGAARAAGRPGAPARRARHPVEGVGRDPPTRRTPPALAQPRHAARGCVAGALRGSRPPRMTLQATGPRQARKGAEFGRRWSSTSFVLGRHSENFDSSKQVLLSHALRWPNGWVGVGVVELVDARTKAKGGNGGRITWIRRVGR